MSSVHALTATDTPVQNQPDLTAMVDDPAFWMNHTPLPVLLENGGEFLVDETSKEPLTFSQEELIRKVAELNAQGLFFLTMAEKGSRRKNPEDTRYRILVGRDWMPMTETVLKGKTLGQVRTGLREQNVPFLEKAADSGDGFTIYVRKQDLEKASLIITITEQQQAVAGEVEEVTGN